MRVAIVAALLLAAPVAPARADAAHDPVVNCAGFTRYSVYGEAHVPVGHAPLVSLSLTCRIVGERGDTYEVTSISQAPVVTVAGAPSDIAPGDYEICGSAYAVYADTHVGVTAETCRKSLFDTGPTPPLNQVRCDYERQATIQAWVVEATAVAGRVDAVPVTTTVWCTVSDGGGEVVHAGGSMLGPVAVATAAERHPVAPLTTVCYGMEARYFAVTDTVTACENY